MNRKSYLIRRRGHWTQSSAGMIVVRPNQKSILIIYSADRDDWEFAKGKLEPNETTLMAARRELAEETGLKNIVIQPDWHHSIRYRFSLPKIGLVYKTVKYYLATSRDRVKLSSEHQTYRWATWSEARLLLRHRNYQKLLNKVTKTLNILIK